MGELEKSPRISSSVTSSSSTDSLQTAIKKMGNILEAALNNGKDITQEERFAIAHAYKVAQFRRLNREISESETDGLSIGFTVSEIRAINHFIVQKDKEGQLESFFHKLEKRI